MYKVPDGLVYPLAAAFRTLLEYNVSIEKYEWKDGCSAIDIWEKNKSELAKKVMSFAATAGDNPNAVGKDSTTWDICYMTLLVSQR